jgi:hypothetical protein
MAGQENDDEEQPFCGHGQLHWQYSILPPILCLLIGGLPKPPGHNEVLQNKSVIGDRTDINVRARKRHRINPVVPAKAGAWFSRRFSLAQSFNSGRERQVIITGLIYQLP